MTVSPPLPRYVVDTSVALKWFVESDQSDVLQARKLRESYYEGRCEIRAPELLLIELANALKAGRKFTPREIVEILESLRDLNLAYQAFGWATAATAVEIASACGATVYDSYFLALALESQSILVTADESFLRKTRHYPGIVSIRQLRVPI